MSERIAVIPAPAAVRPGRGPVGPAPNCPVAGSLRGAGRVRRGRVRTPPSWGPPARSPVRTDRSWSGVPVPCGGHILGDGIRAGEERDVFA